MVTVTTTDTQPAVPEAASFALVIDFEKGVGNPSRVFSAAADIIEGFVKLDKVLVRAVDSKIEPLIALEDVEAGSIRIWLCNVLKRTNDDDLKELSWKKAVGRYVVRGKYAVLDWLEGGGKEDELENLSDQIQNLAKETDIKHLPDYDKPDLTDLRGSTRTIQKGIDRLRDRDVVYVEDRETGERHYIVAGDPIVDTESVKEVITSQSRIMILAVKKADFLGDSKWEFRHGGRAIAAKVTDDTFLKSYQAGEIDLRPGDCLKCDTVVVSSYGYDNELVSETFEVASILEILKNREEERKLL